MIRVVIFFSIAIFFFNVSNAEEKRKSNIEELINQDYARIMNDIDKWKEEWSKKIDTTGEELSRSLADEHRKKMEEIKTNEEIEKGKILSQREIINDSKVANNFKQNKTIINLFENANKSNFSY